MSLLELSPSPKVRPITDRRPKTAPAICSTPTGPTPGILIEGTAFPFPFEIDICTQTYRGKPPRHATNLGGTSGEDEADEGDDLAGTEGEGEEEELPARRSVDKHDRLDEETDQADEMAGGHEPGGEGDEPAGGQAVHGAEAGAEGNRRVDDGEDAETERHEDSREGDDERGDRQAVEKLPNFR